MPILSLLALAILLLGSSCNDGPTGGDPDKTPPSVALTTPAAGATEVAVTTAVTITFTEKIDSGSVTSSSLHLDNGATVSYSFADKTVTMVPVAELLAGTTYTVTVGSAIRDLAGNRMVRDTVFTFTTMVDPNTLPPTVIATSPVSNAIGVATDAVISATFSKGMDTTSVSSAFSVDLGVTGALTWSGNTATFTPSADLAFDSVYTVTIGTAAKDTFDLALVSPVVWSFTVQSDPATPIVTITSPVFEEIVGDTMVITSNAVSSAGIDSVTYFINSFPIGTSTIAPYSLTYVIVGLNIGDGFGLTATAYADNQGITLSGSSPEIDLIYKWLLIGQDNPNPSTFLDELWVRSSDSVVEFRVSYWENWNQFPYPYDTTYFDSAIGHDTTVTLGDDTFAFAMYIDADRSSATGRNYWGTPTTPLNGMGADFLAYVGLFGGHEALTDYQAGLDTFFWVLDTTGLASHRVLPDTNVFEIGFRWSDLQNSSAIDVFLINADFSGGVDPSFDYFPELGTSVFRIVREDRYKGAPGSAKSPLFERPRSTKVVPIVEPVERPFD